MFERDEPKAGAMEERPVIICSALDMDDCVFNKNYNRDEHNAVSANPQLLQHIQDKYRADNAQSAIVLVGSNRQSYELDYKNSRQLRGRQTGSAYPVLMQIATELGNDERRTRVSLSPILLPDILSDQPIGTAFFSAMQDVGVEARYNHPLSIFEEKKFFIVLTQIQALAAAYPDEEIHYHFYDDRADYLDYLHAIFSLNPALVPKNVCLEFFHYDGTKEPELWRSRYFEFPQYPRPASGVTDEIRGTGKIDENYRDAIKKLIHMALVERGGSLLKGGLATEIQTGQVLGEGDIGTSLRRIQTDGNDRTLSEMLTDIPAVHFLSEVVYQQPSAFSHTQAKPRLALMQGESADSSPQLVELNGEETLSEEKRVPLDALIVCNPSIEIRVGEAAVPTAGATADDAAASSSGAFAEQPVPDLNSKSSGAAGSSTGRARLPILTPEAPKELCDEADKMYTGDFVHEFRLRLALGIALEHTSSGEDHLEKARKAVESAITELLKQLKKEGVDSKAQGVGNSLVLEIRGCFQKDYPVGLDLDKRIKAIQDTLKPEFEEAACALKNYGAATKCLAALAVVLDGLLTLVTVGLYLIGYAATKQPNKFGFYQRVQSAEAKQVHVLEDSVNAVLNAAKPSP